MPFLGPLIVAWIILGVGVMATYFLVIARNEGRVEEPWEAPFRQSRESAPPTRWVRPQFGASQVEDPAPTAVRSYSNLPAYDMENVSDDYWTSQDSVLPEPAPARPVPPMPRAPRVASHWAASPPPEPSPVARGSDYDMENYPADQWGSLAR
jgi:hypothetical protein